ncbi:sodium:solute symporter family protein [Luteibaculum oceani]|nr:sodium:solute symporter family protein [Luteibaculum oceani]
MRSSKAKDDYYVGGRSMGRWHIGLSVVATDVGGGFSIGLGGLGFLIGLSGSWMLFTGLIGAILSGVYLVPKVYQLSAQHKFLTFPQLFKFLYNGKVAMVAAVISAIGYWGFTSSQILAGAKLASGTFDILSLDQALWLMGGVAVVYTVMGGLKAVIYTDTVQWILLLAGLIFIGIPLSIDFIGGWDRLYSELDPSTMRLDNVSWSQLINWAITIIPIWFVGMTLYQRIYASKSAQEAKKAWFIAGFFEWPVMAFLGTLLGVIAKVAWLENQIELPLLESGQPDAETGLPVLLKTVFPVGLLGLIMSAYFSAIMSTADSCLMAASGNIVSDLIEPNKKGGGDLSMVWNRAITFLVGGTAMVFAGFMTNVLDLMLLSYAFMVSGLLVPLLGGFFGKNHHPNAAIGAMIGGGVCTLALEISGVSMPYDLDPNLFGLTTSLVIFYAISTYFKRHGYKHNYTG